MADRETDTAEETAPPRSRSGGKKGPRANIQVEGIELPDEAASEVLASASGKRGRNGGPVVDAAAQKFAKAIRNPMNKIIAARLQPQTMADGTPLGDTFELPCHEGQTVEEIKRDIAEARGGRKWIIRVFDDEEKVVASKAENISGPPRLDPMLGELETEGPPMEPETMLSEEEQTERALAADPEVIKAQKKRRLTQIAAEQEEDELKLAEIRARRAEHERAIKGEANNGNGKHRHDEDDEETSKLSKLLEQQLAPMREQNKALQQQLDEEKKRNAEKESKEERRRELESVTAPLKAAQEATQKALETFMTKMGAPPAGPTPAEILTKLEAMETRIKSDTKDQIAAAINAVSTQFNTKVDSLHTLLTTMKKGDDPAVTALINLATAGGKGGSTGSNPFSDVKQLLSVLKDLQDVKGQGEVQPPDFPSFLVEKMAETTPEVLNFFREQRGAVPTKEEIEKMMRGAAMKMYDGLNASMQKELQSAFQRISGGGGGAPAPAPLPAPTSQPTQVVVAPAGPGSTPTPVAFPGSQPPATATAPEPAPTVGATPAVLTPNQLWESLPQADRQEYAKRVNYVLSGLAREMEIGANEMQWPQHAIDKLPRRIIEQLVDAEKDTDVYEIVRRYADVRVLDKIWSFLTASHPRHEWYQGWLATGINWIKEAEGAELVQPADGESPVVDDAQ